jgi:predicted nucleotidyltransferase
MEASVAAHLHEITDACRQYQVSRLELFGSATDSRFDRESSDVDFLVEFAPLREGEYADVYFGLRETLQFDSVASSRFGNGSSHPQSVLSRSDRANTDSTVCGLKRRNVWKTFGRRPS